MTGVSEFAALSPGRPLYMMLGVTHLYPLSWRVCLIVLQYSGVCHAPVQKINVGKDGILYLLLSMLIVRSYIQYTAERSKSRVAAHRRFVLYRARQE